MAGTGNTAPHSAGATIKQKIAATFELFFLFGRGIKPFEKEGTKAHALRSIWIVIAGLPLGFYSMYLHPAKELVNLPYSTIALIQGGHMLISFIVSTALGYLFCIAVERKDRFWLWFQTGNWMTIPYAVVSAPVLALAVLGNHEPEEMERAFTVLLYYTVIVSGCVAFRAFKIDWTLAGFFCLMSIYVSQQIMNLMYWLNGVPINWWG